MEKKTFEIDMIQYQLDSNLKDLFNVLDIELTEEQIHLIDRCLSGWMYGTYWLMDYVKRLPENVEDMIHVSSRRKLIQMISDDEFDWSVDEELEGGE
jgi:hypothetical protein